MYNYKQDNVSGTLNIVIPPIKKPRRKVYRYQRGDYESVRADTLKFAKSYSDTRSVQIQNQNSLLVKRQTDNSTTPGGMGLDRRGLYPSSHKRSKFRHTIILQFNRGDQRIREFIPISNSLGEKTV